MYIHAICDIEFVNTSIGRYKSAYYKTCNKRAILYNISKVYYFSTLFNTAHGGIKPLYHEENFICIILSLLIILVFRTAIYGNCDG